MKGIIQLNETNPQETKETKKGIEDTAPNRRHHRKKKVNVNGWAVDRIISKRYEKDNNSLLEYEKRIMLDQELEKRRLLWRSSI